MRQDPPLSRRGIPGLLLTTLIFWTGCAPPDSRPNLFLITIDTLRADHLASYGHDRAQTPNINAFADTAVRFERALTVSNNTLPAHLSMLTGMFPHSLGVPRNGFILPEETPTLAKILKENGYETAAFISASSLSSTLNTHIGFDIFSESFDVKEIDQVQRIADHTIESVLDYLAQSKSKPFFIWIHLFDPHYPYTPPDPFDSIFGTDYSGRADGSMKYLMEVWGRESPRIETDEADRRRLIDLYDGEIAYIDNAMKDLFEFIERPDIREKSAVILTADHGESLTEHDYLFDHGEFLYQPTMHVPFILRLRGNSIAPRTETALVQGTDIFPTFLAIAGIQIPQETDGRNLLPLLDGRVSSVRETAFGESCRPWELEDRFPGKYKNLYKAQMAVEWPYKLIVTPYLGKVELFNLVSDPDELNNISSDYPEKVEELKTRIESWRRGGTGVARPDLENMDQLRALGYVD